jgi:hypothetical protein
MADRKRVAKPGGVKAHAKLEDTHHKVGAREPVREEKLDRNGPCSCGSGKKYKKCCADSGPTLWMRIKSFFGKLLPRGMREEKSA